MSRSFICHLAINDGQTIVASEVSQCPPEIFERKETGHYDGRYVIHHVNWNDHAERHEVIYYRK